MKLLGCRADSDDVERRLAESEAYRQALLETQKFLDVRKQDMLDHWAQLEKIPLHYYSLFIAGHGLRPDGIYRTVYLTADYAGSEQEHQSCSLTGREIKEKLPAVRVSQTLFTDFCCSGNFFELRYALELSSEGAKWVETPEWLMKMRSPLDSEAYGWVDIFDIFEELEPVEATEEMEDEWVDVLGWAELVATVSTVHFAACTSFEASWEDNLGGYFTRAMAETWNERMSLPLRLESIRERVNVRLHASGNLSLGQTPQIFSSSELNLDVECTLEAFVSGANSHK